MYLGRKEVLLLLFSRQKNWARKKWILCLRGSQRRLSDMERSGTRSLLCLFLTRLLFITLL